MLKNRFLNIALLLFASAAFFYGLAHLFTLRFESGDIFPPYSTLRGDPLGSKVFYESVRALPELTVERNEKPLQRFSGGPETTLFYLGANQIYWGESVISAFETVASHGGRVVLTFRAREKDPDQTFFSNPEKSPAKSESPSPSVPPSPSPEDRLEKVLNFDELGKRWKFQAGYNSDTLDSEAEKQGAAPLEGEVAWHSALFFPAVSEPWHVIYALEGRAVLIERSLGAGTLVLASDSYFVSNEAMRADRKPALLAWLVGKSRRLVFDETHHHIFEQPGVATLVRKYRLHGLIAGLLLLTALFVWKSAASFLPRDRTSEEDGGMIAGRDSYSGFTNLLRRGLRPRELLAVCIAEWKKSAPHLAPGLDEKLASIGESGGNPREKWSADDLLHHYEEISRTIAASKWKRTPNA
jgi:hypothetical protein